MSYRLESQRRQAPEPGRPFVDRGPELKLVRDRLEDGIQGKQMPSAVICFWGAFGMGKSWLLLELERRHKLAHPRTLGSHPTVTARLDLNREVPSKDRPALWRNGQLDRVGLIREIWRQLAGQLGADVPDRERAGADEWADAFVSWVTEWAARSATPILMLDTVDDLLLHDQEAFFWVERQVVERMAITDRVLLVFTGRGELRRWRRFQVRRRVQLHRLSAFDERYAGQAVGASPLVSAALYRRTYGHPLVTERLGTALEEKGVNLQVGDRIEQFLEPSLVQSILQEAVAEILKTVPELPAKLGKYASILRWVSVEPLRFLAEGLGLISPEHGDGYYLDRIAELQAHHLLYWNSASNSYEPDPVLRRLLARHLELEEPERFRAAHVAAFAFHRNHLSEYPAYLTRYVPELAYHRALLDLYEPLDSPPPTVRAWWEEFLTEKAPANPQTWAELAQALRRDQELQEVLPAQEYERLFLEAKRRSADALG